MNESVKNAEFRGMSQRGAAVEVSSYYYKGKDKDNSCNCLLVKFADTAVRLFRDIYLVILVYEDSPATSNTEKFHIHMWTNYLCHLNSNIAKYLTFFGGGRAYSGDNNMLPANTGS